jgi:4-amino-4-deoxy-L-arabinose transferase-like glycosyltransferase
MIKKFKIPALLLVAVLIGIITRCYQLQERFLYAHDGDLASWIVKDIVVDKHLRLIGQLTSSPGIFIGPLFYYSLIPFYLLTGMDSIGGLAIPVIIGISTIISIYWVTKKLFSQTAAGFVSLIYAASFSISQTEREMVPTTPVMLWSVWFLYFAHRLFIGDKKSLIWLAVLFSLVWHINLALALVFPVILLAVIRHWKIYKITDFFKPILIFIILSAPLWLFEVKHNFIQTRALAATLISSGSQSADHISKIAHVILYAAKNSTGVFWNNSFNWSVYLIPGILLAGFLYLIIKKRIPRFYLVIFPVWIFFDVVFFAYQSLNLSEYYLNSMNILWVILAGLLLAEFWSSRYTKFISLLIITMIIGYNLNLLFTSNINRFGYNEKKALVSYIQSDAKKHGYPCVSVSYITNPGYNLGYRYFFYLAGLHVNQPKSGSPVYSIIFPLSLVNHLDKTFGALGVINPDYGRYLPAAVNISCQGEDANLTDPMFGFTK